MTPDQLSQKLRRMASALDKTQKPSRGLVAKEINKLIASLGPIAPVATPAASPVAPVAGSADKCKCGQEAMYGDDGLTHCEECWFDSGAKGTAGYDDSFELADQDW